MADVRTLIVAEDPLARAGLAAMLHNEDGINVIGQISPETTMLEVFSHDVALFDLGWELNDALEPLSETPLLELDVPVVVLMPDDEYVTEVIATLNAETRNAPYGVLVRNAPPGKLVAALNSTTEGLISLDPQLAAGLSPVPRPTPLPNMPEESLTPRENEVLNLLAEGLPNKTIALRLTISEYTVKFHVNSILTKLGAASRTEAVVRATRLGLITL
ncbi:MAG: response regulator transcription factor [Chloroflexota bacterium]